MKKVLFTHSYFLRFDPKQWEIMQPYAPLGTLYAAAFLREKGYDVKLWDPMFAHSASELIPHIESFQPDVLVIYDDGFNYLTKMCLTNMREAAFEMSEMAKSRNIPVLVCSSDATDHTSSYLDHGATAILRGEGEITLLEVVNALCNNRTINGIEGITHRVNGETVNEKPRAVMQDLDAFPFPAWELADLSEYKSRWKHHNGYFSINMSTTRGCPFKCNWCAKPIYGNRYNSRSPENVVAEIKMLKQTYQPDHIWFCDDIFGLKPGWVNKFAELLKQEGIQIKYKIQSRVDLLLQENNIMSLADSGCETVWVGAESGSQKILDAMDKGTTVTQIREATLLLKKHHIRPAFFLQFGYPGETEADIQKTISMVTELLPYDIGISVSYPLPGTPFYEKVKSELKEKTNWTDSDELALMFRNTYPSSYYKHLHRYVHKKYRRHQGHSVFKALVGGKIPVNTENIKRALWSVYHLPGEWMHHQKMKQIVNAASQYKTSIAATPGAFSSAAKKYDTEFTHTSTGSNQRQQVHSYLEQLLQRTSINNILELNCGTGEDALWLAGKGINVLATDIAPGMIEIAEQKKGIAKNPSFQCLSIAAISTLAPHSYDLIFSNFGGLNCIDPKAMQQLAADAAHLLKPGGTFVGVVMGRNCMIEKWYFRLKGDSANKNRRLTSGAVNANVDGHTIPIYYFSPDEMESHFSAHFNVRLKRPIGLFTPPSYLESKFRMIPGLPSIAGFLDRNIASRESWSDYADHFLIEFKRK